jgi:hypothetical protein
MNWLEAEEQIDWSNFEAAAQTARRILADLAADRALLTALTLNARRDPSLFAMCERHALDDKIVLYDGLKAQNFRIRWRLANSGQYERLHQHRFSFATHILAGTHYETLWQRREEAQPGPGGCFRQEDFDVCFVREMPAGQAFVLHHDTWHSSATSEGAIALILRGPAEKDRSAIIRLSTGEAWWRYGEKDEDADRRAEVSMDTARFDSWTARLQRAGLIDPLAERA